jgi:hypothetical protein
MAKKEEEIGKLRDEIQQLKEKKPLSVRWYCSFNYLYISGLKYFVKSHRAAPDLF